MTEIAVSVLRMLSSRRCTPVAEHGCLARLGVIALDDTHAAERFGQTARNLAR